MNNDYDYEIVNSRMRPIAEKLIAKYNELKHIKADNVLFVLNKKKSGGKKRLVLAKTFQISPKWQDLLFQISSTGYTHVIEFYEKPTSVLDQNQMTALVYHELAHIDPDGRMRYYHDTEDWWRMIAGLGRDWSCPYVTCPDLLADDVNWETLLGEEYKLLRAG
jgi:predicted metallopeptidase